MKIRKVSYTKHVPDKIEHHYVTFLTESDEILLMGPFLNNGDAARVAGNIMKGKASSLTVIPFPGVVVWEREKYDQRLADMAKAGKLVNCVVVENAPDSIDELQRFAGGVLRAEALGK